MGALAAEELGPYVVYEQIGLGGMATVHRAEAQGIAGFSSSVQTRVEAPPRGASRFLLAVWVLAATAGAAGVVYFVLPYLA